jgi:hypothetical protein
VYVTSTGLDVTVQDTLEYAILNANYVSDLVATSVWNVSKTPEEVLLGTVFVTQDMM